MLILHVGTQLYKTITSYRIGYLNPGYYTFKILHAGSVYDPASVEWQAAKMDVMWFEQTHHNRCSVRHHVLSYFHKI